MDTSLVAEIDPVEFLVLSHEAFAQDEPEKGRLILQVAEQVYLDIYNEFDRKIWMTEAYQRLAANDIDGQRIIDTCTHFRAFVLATLIIKRHLSGAPRGRPQTLLPFFEFLCDTMVHGRRDGRHFYRQFAELENIVFRDRPVSFRATPADRKDYIRRVQRARLLFAELMNPALGARRPVPSALLDAPSRARPAAAVSARAGADQHYR